MPVARAVPFTSVELTYTGWWRAKDTPSLESRNRQGEFPAEMKSGLIPSKTTTTTCRAGASGGPDPRAAAERAAIASAKAGKRRFTVPGSGQRAAATSAFTEARSLWNPGSARRAWARAWPTTRPA